MKICKWTRDHVGNNDNIRERLKVENITERCRKARLVVWTRRGKTKTTSEERLWRWYHPGGGEEEGQRIDGWNVSTET